MSALGPVFGAIKAVLEATPGVTALLAQKPASWGGGAAIYDDGEAPSSAPMPYLTVGSGTQVPFHTFRTAGWNCTVQIKAVNIGTEASGLAIIGAISVACYPGRVLTVTGFTSSWCDEFTVHPTLITTPAGVLTREHPAILRVFAT